MDQVFNELSISGSLPDKYAAMEALLDLYHASVALEELGLSKEIRVTQDFTTRDLTSDYNIQDWKYDKLTGKYQTLRSQLLGRLANAPYVECLCKEQGVTELNDYHLDKTPCNGLALAHLWSIPALTLPYDARFAQRDITITHCYLDDEGELYEEARCVQIVICRADVDAMAEILQTRILADIRNGEDILARAGDIFPYLAFCGNAVKQLQALRESDIYFHRIKEMLRVINADMEATVNKKTVFSPKGMQYKPTESKSTCRSREFQEARTFLCPDGVRRIFQAHVRISQEQRMHIFPHLNTQKVYIGHIGHHLPTTKYPT